MLFFYCNEIIERGLSLVGVNGTSTVCHDTNLERFRSHFGSNPIVYAQIWDDLQTTETDEAKFLFKEQKVSLRHCPPFFYHPTHFRVVFACVSSVLDHLT
jgi:hypothetical protein